MFGISAKLRKQVPFRFMSVATMPQPKLTRDLLEHRQALLGFIYALTRDFDAAEEIFQETALAILAEAAEGRQIEPFLPWAREVARRRVAEHNRAAKAHRAASLPQELIEIVSQSFDENEEAVEALRERQSSLAACLGALTDRVRRMLDARYHGKSSVVEIARTSGWTVDAVHVALSRARKTLAECVERRTRLKGVR